MTLTLRTDDMVEQIAFILRGFSWTCLRQTSRREYRPRAYDGQHELARGEDECEMIVRPFGDMPALFDRLREAGFVPRNGVITQVIDHDGVYYECTLVRSNP